MQEQELSVNDILSSIKKILSSKIEDELTQKSKSEEMPRMLDDERNISFAQQNAPILSDVEEDDVFVLTPAMQVEIDPNMTGLISEKPSAQSPVFAAEQTQEIMMPAVQKWIDENLPQMVERIVSEEVRRIFNTKK